MDCEVVEMGSFQLFIAGQPQLNIRDFDLARTGRLTLIKEPHIIF